MTESGGGPEAVRRGLLFDALARRSEDTRKHLTNGRRVGVEPQEETLTENLLYRLAANRRLKVKIRSFNKHEEGARGADWEWWWEGSTHWFGAVVQAKKLKRLAGGEFGYDFAYRTGSGDLQIDRLLEYAAGRGLPAVYALYNGADLERLDNHRMCQLGDVRKELGVRIVAADTVKRLVDAELAATTAEAATDAARSTRYWVQALSVALPCVLCPGDCFGRRQWPIDFWPFGYFDMVQLDIARRDTARLAGWVGYEARADVDSLDYDLAFLAARAHLQIAPRSVLEQLLPGPDRVLDDVVVGERSVWTVRAELPDYVSETFAGGVTPTGSQPQGQPAHVVLIRGG